MNKALITKIIILTTPLIWIGWDVYAYLTTGNSVTESATLFRWAVHAPGIAFLVGVLCGHLFVPQTEVVQEVAEEFKK